MSERPETGPGRPEQAADLARKADAAQGCRLLAAHLSQIRHMLGGLGARSGRELSELLAGLDAGAGPAEIAARLADLSICLQEHDILRQYLELAEAAAAEAAAEFLRTGDSPAPFLSERLAAFCHSDAQRRLHGRFFHEEDTDRAPPPAIELF